MRWGWRLSVGLSAVCIATVGCSSHHSASKRLGTHEFAIPVAHIYAMQDELHVAEKDPASFPIGKSTGSGPSPVAAFKTAVLVFHPYGGPPSCVKSARMTMELQAAAGDAEADVGVYPSSLLHFSGGTDVRPGDADRTLLGNRPRGFAVIGLTPGQVFFDVTELYHDWESGIPLGGDRIQMPTASDIVVSMRPADIGPGTFSRTVMGLAASRAAALDLTISDNCAP